MSAWPFTVVEKRLGKGLANGLHAYARPPRSLRKPTRWNQDKSPETIYHINIHNKFVCITSCTYSSNYIFARMCTYMHRQASWQFTYSFTSWKCKWTSAYASLPTQQKSTLLSRVSTHTSADCEISGRQPTRLEKEFPRIHNALHSKKNDAHLSICFLTLGHCHLLGTRWLECFHGSMFLIIAIIHLFFCLTVFSYPSVSISKPSQKPPKSDALNIRWCEPNFCELSTLLPWANHDTNYGIISGITCLNLWGVSQSTSKCHTKQTEARLHFRPFVLMLKKNTRFKAVFFSNPQVSFKWMFLNVYLFRKVFGRES